MTFWRKRAGLFRLQIAVSMVICYKMLLNSMMIEYSYDYLFSVYFILFLVLFGKLISPDVILWWYALVNFVPANQRHFEEGPSFITAL